MSNHIVLWILLVFLIVISAFFSSSETAMMSLNRYRLRNDLRKGRKHANTISGLLSRPDRLLGMILLGNTFANILASAVATVLAVAYFGEVGLIVSTVILTLVVLIFAETAPKTLAALYPETVAYPFAALLAGLLRIVYPLVWLINLVANGLLRLFGLDVKRRQLEGLSFEEFRTLVTEAKGKISDRYSAMLMRVLDLEKVTVEHVMTPKSDVYTINLDQPWEQVVEQLKACPYSYAPVASQSLNAIDGVLSMQQALLLLTRQSADLVQLKALVQQPYFVPAGAELTQQFFYFRQHQLRLAFVVDEYGNLQGLVTLRDIVEEVVGEFTLQGSDFSFGVEPQKDGSVLVEGGVNILDLNRRMDWQLPIDGPKTLSGLIIETLETIPEGDVGLRVAGYPMEIVEIENNRITVVRVWPGLHVKV